MSLKLHCIFHSFRPQCCQVNMFVCINLTKYFTPIEPQPNHPIRILYICICICIYVPNWSPKLLISLSVVCSSQTLHTTYLHNHVCLHYTGLLILVLLVIILASLFTSPLLLYHSSPHTSSKLHFPLPNHIFST